jgi:8-oxo-dGTP pyrophosphatase MutT (NUDIX family)
LVRRYRGRRLKVEDLVSAGGIVYRLGERAPEVVLCGRIAAGLWGLPKGTPHDGETIEETACREVREETGLDVVIERKVGEIEYWFARAEQGKRFHKRVHHYLMVSVGGDVDRHDHEYDVVGWFPIDEAERMLTYENEAEVLRRAIALVRERIATDACGGPVRREDAG